MTRLLATTALGLVLGLGAAIAQQAPADDPANPPAMMPSDDAAGQGVLPSEPSEAPAMKSEPSAPSELEDQTTEAPKDIVPDAGDKSKSAQFLTQQDETEWLASNLIGQSVVNAENEQLGVINDLVAGDDGKIHAALIGVGGFLGIGEKNVAVHFEDIKLARDENNTVTAMLNTNKDSLAQAPDFKMLSEQEVVEGSIKTDREGGSSGY